MAHIQKTEQSWKVTGDMTVAHATELLNESRHLPMDGLLVIDFSDVEQVDTATISLIFEWLRHAQKKKCDLSFANFPSNLLSLIALYGVNELIPQQKH